MTDQIELEEKALEEALERGEISRTAYNRELNDLRRSYQNAAREAAQDAYDRELEKW